MTGCTQPPAPRGPRSLATDLWTTPAPGCSPPMAPGRSGRTPRSATVASASTPKALSSTVIDLGGNIARHNQPPQCIGVVCTPLTAAPNESEALLTSDPSTVLRTWGDTTGSELVVEVRAARNTSSQARSCRWRREQPRLSEGDPVASGADLPDVGHHPARHLVIPDRDLKQRGASPTSGFEVSATPHTPKHQGW